MPSPPVRAERAGYWRVRVPSYACTDPRATAQLVERASHHQRLRAFAHRLGGCFHIHPGERWELLSAADDQLLLMRRVPPHAGEPPLYFQASLVAPLADRPPGATPARPQPLQAAETGTRHRPAADTLVPAAALPGTPRAVAPGVPAAAPPASATRAMPTPPVAASPVAPPAAGAAATAAAPGRVGIAAAAAAPHRVGVFMLWVGPMLVWAVLAGLLAYGLRRLLRRRAPDVAMREAIEGAPLSRVRIAERRPRREPGPPGERKEPQGPAGPTSPQPRAPQAPRLLSSPLPGFPPTPAALTLDRPCGAALSRAEGSLRDYRSRCVARLRGAGWDARPPLTSGIGATDVLASNGSLLVALRCHASSEPVGIEAVEDACLARERHRSDLGAIVSNAPFTPSARELATSTGIVLLREDELASFAA